MVFVWKILRARWLCFKNHNCLEILGLTDKTKEYVAKSKALAKNQNPNTVVLKEALNDLNKI